jgi:hypothetical protein
MQSAEGTVGFEFGSAGGLFPFLSVMFCTIGVLSLILVAGSMRAAGKTGDTDDRMARVQGEAEELARREAESSQELSMLQDRQKIARTGALELAKLGSLLKRTADAALKTEALAARMDPARAAVKEARAIPEKIEVLTEQRSLRIAITGDTAARGELEETLAELENRRAELTRGIADATTAARSAAIDIDLEGDMLDARPAFIDLAPDALTCHTEGLPAAKGTRIAAGAARGDDGTLARIAKAVAKPGSGTFAVFLVRPGATGLYREAEEQMRRYRGRFAAEPVDAEWRFVEPATEVAPEADAAPEAGSGQE